MTDIDLPLSSDTIKQLLSELEKKLQKWDEYRLVITKENWQQLKAKYIKPSGE